MFQLRTSKQSGAILTDMYNRCTTKTLTPNDTKLIEFISITCVMNNLLLNQDNVNL
jgi:hypothetical protein